MKKNKLKNIVLSLSLAFAMTAANADFESSLVKFGDLDFVNTEDKNYQTYGDSETVKEEEDNTKNQCDTYGSSADDLVSEFLSTDCNSSIFPYYEGSQQDGGDPDDEIGAPPGSGAATEEECTCGEKPYEWTGTPKGMWFPIRVVEIVRGDGSCTPTQGNSTNNMLSKLKKILLGGNSSETARGNQISSNGELGFKHFHSWKIDEDTYSDYTDDYYSNPSERCFNDNTKGEDLESSVDYAYWSSNNPLKINLLYPEYTLIVGLLYAADTKSKFPVTTVLNTASCLIQTTGQGVRADDYVYWQGGCYPDNLPANGHFSNAKGLVDSSQLILQRSVMFSGRGTLPFSKESKDRGYASYGTVKEYMKYNICSAKPTMGGFPMKSHYKFSMLKPFTEAEDESDTSANSGNSEIDSSVNQENTNKAISSGNSSLNGMSSGNVDKGGLSSITGKIGGLGSSATGFISDKLNLDGLTGQVTDWVGVTTKCAHRWGASSMRWGTGRNPRNDGEAPETNGKTRPTETKDKDAVYIVWRWVECCEPNGDSGGGGGGMKPGSGPF
ncbi:MAG: TraU family protein [Neisseriaceae bacterium]|nr:TraU family protein [Neisseriaceae bacterium]